MHCICMYKNSVSLFQMFTQKLFRLRWSDTVRERWLCCYHPSGGRSSVKPPWTHTHLQVCVCACVCVCESQWVSVCVCVRLFSLSLCLCRLVLWLWRWGVSGEGGGCQRGLLDQQSSPWLTFNIIVIVVAQQQLCQRSPTRRDQHALIRQ